MLDPTSGSGTTAAAAEQWGRRWIAIDSSRVAVAVARQRLLTAKFDTYKTKDASEGIDPAWFLSAVLVRDLALLALVAAVVRDVLRPAADVVRADGVDDPAGGVLSGAPDRVPDRAPARRLTAV